MQRRHFLKQSLVGAALTTVGAFSRSNTSVAVESKDVLNLIGPNASSSHCFNRMFPDLSKQGATNPKIEEGLIELGSNMKDDPTKPPTHSPPMAGYTYLGQFIDHDLTLDLTPLRLAGKRPVTETPNFRSARLDLDQVYGGGPDLSPFLYQRNCLRGEERFLLGLTVPSFDDGHSFKASLDDLPRNSEGVALTADPRQDENLILAQLHVAFLKLHNLVMERPNLLEASKHYRAAGSTFEAARRLVSWHYQWVVRHDFLENVLDPQIFEQMSDAESKAVRYDSRDFRIPVEFSVAAFRFGHSMVRDEYFVNDAHMDVSLESLLQMTDMHAESGNGLSADWVVDWKRFFFVGPGKHSARRSRAIDTRIAQALHGMPMNLVRPSHVALASKSPFALEMTNLPVRTLLRGARVGLPSGQDVAGRLGFQVLNPDEVAEGPDKEILRRYGHDRDTPLWYYILKEAELYGKGQRLGPTGSKLVADVISAALLNDPESYLSVDSKWVPTMPAKIPGSFGMADLLLFVNELTKVYQTS